jgi:hypothetical protein
LSFLLAGKSSESSHLFLPLKMIKSNFPSFFRHKKWQSLNFRTFSDLKNGKVQISKLFPNISELFHSEFRTQFGISCYGRSGCYFHWMTSQNRWLHSRSSSCILVTSCTVNKMYCPKNTVLLYYTNLD